MNKYGNRDRCIFLEFNYVVGTDAIFYPDGRYSNFNVESEIIRHVQYMRKFRPNLQLVGFQRKNSNQTYSFSAGVLELANN